MIVKSVPLRGRIYIRPASTKTSMRTLWFLECTYTFVCKCLRCETGPNRRNHSSIRALKLSPERQAGTHSRRRAIAILHSQCTMTVFRLTVALLIVAASLPQFCTALYLPDVKPRQFKTALDPAKASILVEFYAPWYAQMFITQRLLSAAPSTSVILAFSCSESDMEVL